MQRFDSVYRMIVVRGLILMALVLSDAARLSSADNGAESARQTLLSSGLTQMGHNWLCAEELDMRRLLGEIERLKTEHKNAHEAVDEVIATNHLFGRNLQKAENRHTMLVRQAQSERANSAERRRLEELVKSNKKVISGLKRKFRDENQFGDLPQVRRRVVRLVNARNAIALSIIAIRRDAGAIATSYPNLRSQRNIRAAIADLGGRHRLGPARDYRPDLARVTKIAALVNSPHVPVYRQDDHFRVPVIVNDRFPTVFSVRHSAGETVVPFSLLRAAGIEVAENAPHAVLVVNPRRRLKVRRIVIDSLRIGPAVYRNIEALALPAEGEDLGAKLGKNAYAQQPFEIEGLKLRLTVDPPAK